MNQRDLSHLKDFLAAELGVQTSEISDQQAKSRYRKRWAMFFVGLLILVGAYLLINRVHALVPAKVLVGSVVLASLMLNVFRLWWPSALSPGRLAITKKELSKRLQTDVDGIDERVALEYVRGEQRSILVGLLFLALTVTFIEWVWPSAVLDLVVILCFYAVGMLAFTELLAMRR